MSNTTPDPIRILIIEDNLQYTRSLTRMIQLSQQMQFTASYTSAEGFLDGLDEKAKDQTNMVLLDLNLPGKSGLQLVPAIHKEMPESNILVITQDRNYHTTLEAIRLGASGYILKKSSIAALREAIIEVHQGGCIIDPQLSRIVLKTLSGNPDIEEDNLLTAREQQVLEFLSMGYVKKEVAERMEISYSAVAQYTENIYKKLQVPNVTAAVATAIRKGLI